MYVIELLYIFRMAKEHNAFAIPSYHFRLITVLFIICAAVFKQFAQVLFIKLYKHDFSFICQLQR